MSEYNEYDSSSKREKRIREQEAARRAEEERRMELELRQEISRKNEEQLRIFKSDFLQLASGTLSSFLQATDVNELRKKIGIMESKNQPAASSTDLQRLSNDIASLHKRMLDTEITARHRYNEHLYRLERARKQQAMSKGLDDLTARIAELKKNYSKDLLDDQVILLQNGLKESRFQFDKGQFDEALVSLKNAQTAYGAACAVLTFRATTHDKLERLSESIDRALQNPIYRTWVGRALESLRSDVQAIIVELPNAAITFASLFESRTNTIVGTLAALLANGDKKQEDELVRRSVLDALLEVLREEGFTVSAPRLEAGQDSDVIIAATKPGKARPQAVHAKIGLSGRVAMDVDSGDPGDVVRIREAQVDRGKERGVACRQTADRIKEMLEGKGVRLTSRKTSWHNPDRIAKTARSLPEGAPKSQHIK